MVSLGRVFQNRGKRNGILSSKYLTSGTCCREAPWKLIALAHSKQDERVRKSSPRAGNGKKHPLTSLTEQLEMPQGYTGTRLQSVARLMSPPRAESPPALPETGTNPGHRLLHTRGCGKRDVLRFTAFCMRLSNSSVSPQLCGSMMLDGVALKICSEVVTRQETQENGKNWQIILN